MCEDALVSVQGCGQLGAWLVLVQVCGPQVTLSPPAVGSLEVAGLGLGGPDDPEG